MTANNKGWDWFDDSGNPSKKEGGNPNTDMAISFAKCFRGHDGEQVLKYLRAMTLECQLSLKTDPALAFKIDPPFECLCPIRFVY